MSNGFKALLLATMVIVSPPAFASWGDCNPASHEMDRKIKLLFDDLKNRGINLVERNQALMKMQQHYALSERRQRELIENRPGNQFAACDDYYNRLYDMLYRQTYRYFNIPVMDQNQ